MTAKPPENVRRPLILLVDDEPRIAEFVVATFSRSDYDVRCASHGRDGIRMAEELTPDVILLDVMMPDESGYTICRELREHATLATVPIIMITALSDRRSRLQGIEAGADEFITKPIDVEELRARVRVVTRLNRFRKQLEQQRQFARLVDLAPDGILVLDRTLCIRFANGAANRLFRSSADLELVESSFPMILLKDEETVAQRLVEIAGAERSDRLGGLRMLRLDGGEILADISVGPFRWENRPALLLLIRDVTAQRLLEQRLQRLQRLDSLGAIAGGVAHDLNNVMMPILLAARSLETAADPETRRQITATITAAARHGTEVVEQILAFTRGGATVEPRNLREVVAAAMALHGAGNDNIEKTVEADEDAGTVMAAAADLQQVLGNLITNAREAMPHGGRLRVRLTRADAANARIEITDTGPGMDETARQRLGEAFFTTKPEGTGLGFSTARTIVRRLGGDILVRSAPGAGTTMTVLLPTRPAQAEAAAPATIDLTGVKLVVAETDAALRQLTSETLECLGAEVLRADTPAELQQIAARHCGVDLLLGEPSFNAGAGAAAVAALTRSSPRVRFIQMGGPAADAARDDRLRLPKPYGRDELVAAVHSALTTTGDKNHE